MQFTSKKIISALAVSCVAGVTMITIFFHTPLHSILSTRMGIGGDHNQQAAVGSVSNGLVAYYTFDEGSGNTIADSSGNNSGNGIASGNPVWTLAGKDGGALSFDGVDDTVSFSTPLGALPNFTLTAWVKIDPTSSSNNVLWAGEYINWILLRSQGIYIEYPDISLVDATDSNLEGWIHVAIVKSPSTLSFYRNGVLIKTQTAANSATNFASYNVGIAYGYAFKGLVDDYRIYNRVLSQTEIKTIINPVDADAPTTPTNLLGSPISETQINLNWNPSTDNIEVAGYKIMRDSGSGFVQIATSNTISYQDTGLQVATTYRYQIKAYDAVGNESLPSLVISIKPILSLCTGQTNRICTAQSGSSDDVQAAIDQALLDGDTVVIPNGTWTWTKQVVADLVTRPRSLVIQGGGIDQTTIIGAVPMTDANQGRPSALTVTTAKGKSVRITRFTFKTSPAMTDTSWTGLMFISGDSKALRVDNIKFETTSADARAVYITGWQYGVVDHNIFNIANQGVNIHHNTFGDVLYGDGSWAYPLALGTEKAIYIEDNVFDGGEGNQKAVTDGYNGGRFVVRNNTIINAGVNNHGTDSSGRLRGIVSYEVYNNIFSMPAGKLGFVALEGRGGTGVFYNNTINGAFGAVIRLKNYRQMDAFGQPFQGCDGTGPYDQNDPTIYVSGSHTGPTTSGGTLTDGTKTWTPNQWVGYSVRNTTLGWGTQVVSNTATVLTLAPSAFGTRPVNTGDNYKLLRAISCVDQVGRSGPSTLLSGWDPTPVGWPNQTIEPFYSWNNTWNSQSADVDSKMIVDGYTIQKGRDYFFGVQRPAYTAYPYPHPLTLGQDTIIIAPPPTNTVITTPVIPPTSTSTLPSTVTPDLTSPSITTITASSFTTSATITWTTNELSTTRIEYGLTTSYGSLSTLISAPLTSHAQQLTGLTSNTLYHYRVISTDAAGNTTTSGDGTFSTSNPTASTQVSINIPPANVTGRTTSLTSNGNATSTQTLAKCLPTSTPSALPTLPTFTPILKLGSRGTNVTTLQSFLAARNYLARTSVTGYYGPLTDAAVKKYIQDKVTRNVVTSCPTTPVTSTTTTKYIFTRTLQLGSKGEDVRQLQMFLNTRGFKVAATGKGSPGQEIITFGPATKAAVIKFQIANNIRPTSGVFGPITRGRVNTAQY